MLLKIIVRNILHKPLGTILSITLLALSTGIISLLLQIQDQAQQKFENDLRDIDLVVGAKGSPLQLVLSAVYHVDAPTGNISLADVLKVTRNPLVKQVTPLAYGDSYKGNRIVGTDSTYLLKYEATYAQGRVFQADLEAVVGANVALTNNLQIGQSLLSTHGEAAEGEVHADHAYKVVGILKPSNTVLDNLVLTNVATVWEVHSHEEDEAADTEHEAATDDHAGEKDHDHGDEKDHDHADEKDHDHADHAEDQQITAMLVKFRSPMGIMSLPRMVNETTTMQAAVPALEINRLLSLMGIGVTTLQLLALSIMVISGFSVFIALYNRLKERKYELALLRSLGCSRGRLFFLLMAEGFLLALSGFIAGMLLSRLGLWILNRTAGRDFHVVFSSKLLSSEVMLGLVVIGVGVVAALIPAIKAYRMQLSAALADQ